MKACSGKRFAAAAYLGLALTSGCMVPQAPTPILVPTPVYCVTGSLPAEPPRVQHELTGDSGLDIGKIAGSAIALRAWGQALRGMLDACRAPAPPAVSPPPAPQAVSPPPDDPGTPPPDGAGQPPVL